MAQQNSPRKAFGKKGPDLGEKNLVIDALESPKYKWRTVEGISRETSLPEESVLEILSNLSSQGLLVRATKIDTSDPNRGQLITTRKHYINTRDTFTRLRAAISDRII